jgi:hypothetical protein
MLLQACLGIQINGQDGRLSFSYPILPESLQEVRIQRFPVGQGSVDLLLLRHGDDVGINVLRRQGRVEILMVK